MKSPLISYPIKEALQSKIFSDVIVSSDDDETIKIAKKYGALTVLRSKKNSSDIAHELEACREYFSILTKNKSTLPNFFCLIYPTAVLIKSKDLKNSYNLIKNKSEVDVVMGVSAFNYHPYKALVQNKNGFLTPIFKKNTVKGHKPIKACMPAMEPFIGIELKVFLIKSI